MNSKLHELGFTTLKDDFHGKAAGKRREKMFKLICEKARITQNKMKTVQICFEKSISAETPPGIKEIFKEIKGDGALLALITDDAEGLGDNLKKIGLSKEMFDLIQVQTEKSGNGNYLKKVITWSDSRYIGRDEIIFAGSRSNHYLSSLSIKPEISFLGVVSGMKFDRFYDMGLAEEYIVPFWALADCLRQAVYDYVNE